MSTIRHRCSGDRQIRLVVIETGEELAANLKQAVSLGLIEWKVKDETAGQKTGGQVTSDGTIGITITLPATDVALFNIARRTSESG